MNNPDDSSRKRSYPRQAIANGKDEMNLAEFPFASLRTRGDSRDAIVHEGHVVDKEGNRHHQRWVVSGDSVVGLPNEFDERVYVALMAITSQQGFASRKVPFSIYQALKLMGQGPSRRTYGFIEQSLDRLKGVTIKAKGAFYDNARHELVHTAMAFNLIDKYWLRYREQDEGVREEEGVPAYIVWGEDIWRSFQAGYIKDLDIAYFYSLENPTARRLFRFLDKRMHYQDTYEIDVFELASRLGMTRYPYTSRVRSKLQPALDELIASGFLKDVSYPDHQGYIRARFVRAPRIQEAPETPASHEEEGILDQLVSTGVSSDVAARLVGAFDTEYIQGKIELLRWRLTTAQRGRPITDPAAWLIRAIEQDYQPPPTFKTAAQRQRKQEEQDRIWRQFEQHQQELHEQEKRRREQELAQLHERHGTTDHERGLWSQVLNDLSLQMVKPAFQLWVANSQLLSLKEGVATIGVPSQMAADWLSKRLTTQLASAIAGVTNEPVTLQFEVVALGDQHP